MEPLKERAIIWSIGNQLLGNWKLVRASNIAIAKPPVVNFTGNKVSLKYCNYKSGSYSRRGSDITLGNMATTGMYCLGLNPSESVVEQALQSCKKLRFTASGLDCYSA